MISHILGLGNPGEKYNGTRHNIGFDLVDALCEQLRVKKTRETGSLIEYQARFRDNLITLAKPMTYMNLSGLAALDLLQQHSLAPDKLLVVVDDFSLPLGTIRFRAEGTDGGHNGLASIIEHIQTDRFPRLRLGIGPVADNMSTSDFVLSKFKPDEIEIAARMVESATEAVTFAITHHLNMVMSKHNRPPALPEQE